MLDRLRTLWQRLSLLQICLGFSVAVHAGLFGFRFVDPEGFNRVFKDTPLEVILVNAGSEAPPEKAQALAQLNLAGGGDADDQRRATSPLPPTPEAALAKAASDGLPDIESGWSKVCVGFGSCTSASTTDRQIPPPASNCVITSASALTITSAVGRCTMTIS